jgi:hypothetical protein
MVIYQSDDTGTLRPKIPLPLRERERVSQSAREELRDAAKAFAEDPSQKNYCWLLDISRRLPCF